MSAKVAGMNPRVLRWARRSAGRTIEEVASAFKKDPDVIRAWEKGDDAPTYVQLEKLARRYRRPVAMFFFPAPPDEAPPSRAFRTLPQSQRDTMAPDTRFALREARATQLALRELTGGRSPWKRLIWRDVGLRPSVPVTNAAHRVREYLGVSLETQRGWRDARRALREWRAAVQEAGVFAFRRPLKQRDVSGFSLVDPEFPVIYLNSSTALTRQVFSLLHELAHMLLGESGVTKGDDSYIDDLAPRPRRVEVYCSKLASEIVLPSQEFDKWECADLSDDDVVTKLARDYSVSPEVILRKALDRGLVGRAHYEAKAAQWAAVAGDHIRRQRTRQGGGDYYVNQASYLGQHFLRLAFGSYYRGRCTRDQLADYLNVSARAIDGLEPFAVAGEEP